MNILRKILRKNLQKLTGSLVMVAAMSALSSCSTFSLVNSEIYNNADLADYKTFRIVTPDSRRQLPPGMEMVTYYNIAAAIRAEMMERGFTESADAPLLINIGLTVHREIATEPLYQAMPPVDPSPWYFGPGYNGYYPWFMYPRSYYWPAYYNPNAQVITGMYDEGVLTMDFIDLPHKEALYSASVATIINGGGQFRNLKGISEAVTTLFSKFPVPLLPQYRKR